jgi:hypothetical protein
VLACVLAPSCADRAPVSAGEVDAPHGVNVIAKAQAGDGGAASDLGSSVAGDGGASMQVIVTPPNLGGQAESQADGETAAGAASGGATDASAGAANAAGTGSEPGEAPPAAGCEKLSSGTFCGPNMAPPGAPATRYFCSSGTVIAAAPCPGECDVNTNTCLQSNGTGGGLGDTGVFTLLHCRSCYQGQCAVPLSACSGDALCDAYLSCLSTCSSEAACYAVCDKAFADEPLLAKLNQCVEASGCAKFCTAL